MSLSHGNVMLGERLSWGNNASLKPKDESPK